LDWLGWDDHETLLPFASSTPASILQFAMENKWVLKPADKDQIVMVHEIEYQIDGKTKYLKSWLIDTGLDAVRTAMARTVGLPIGMAAVQFLEKRWTAKGLQIPILPIIYEPVLTELRSYGLVFHESEN
jgi:saccharopine dehydrogenase (NADP+, L-glutamate forming)